MSGWKHDKLSNSEVMKEFEKVAYEKGMIEDNSIIEAAKRIKKDVKSDSLISNLFSLANKLKQEGFDKYADELEKKIMAYQVSKIAGEKDGEKLLEFAHPEGSPSVGDGEDGNVENLIDQHKKMVEVARKSPMSKKNAKVLADVMVALGQQSPEELNVELIEKKRQAFNALDKEDSKKLCSSLAQIFETNKSDIYFYDSYRVAENFSELYKSLDKINEKNISTSLLQEAANDCRDILGARLKEEGVLPGINIPGFSGIGGYSDFLSPIKGSSELRKKLINGINHIRTKLYNANKILESSTVNATEEQFNKFKLDNLAAIDKNINEGYDKEKLNAIRKVIEGWTFNDLNTISKMNIEFSKIKGPWDFVLNKPSIKKIVHRQNKMTNAKDTILNNLNYLKQNVLYPRNNEEKVLVLPNDLKKKVQERINFLQKLNSRKISENQVVEFEAYWDNEVQPYLNECVVEVNEFIQKNNIPEE